MRNRVKRAARDTVSQDKKSFPYFHKHGKPIKVSKLTKSQPLFDVSFSIIHQNL